MDRRKGLPQQIIVQRGWELMFDSKIWYSIGNDIKPYAIEVCKYTNAAGSMWDFTIFHEDLKPKGCREYYNKPFKDVGELFEFVCAKLNVLTSSLDVDLRFTHDDKDYLNYWLHENFS